MGPTVEDMTALKLSRTGADVVNISSTAGRSEVTAEDIAEVRRPRHLAIDEVLLRPAG